MTAQLPGGTDQRKPSVTSSRRSSLLRASCFVLRATCYLLSAFHGLPFCVVAGGVFAVGSLPGEPPFPYAPGTVLDPVKSNAVCLCRVKLRLPTLPVSYRNSPSFDDSKQQRPGLAQARPSERGTAPAPETSHQPGAASETVERSERNGAKIAPRVDILDIQAAL